MQLICAFVLAYVQKAGFPRRGSALYTICLYLHCVHGDRNAKRICERMFISDLKLLHNCKLQVFIEIFSFTILVLSVEIKRVHN